MYINWKRQEMTITLVLYGPPGSGKTATWRYLSQGADEQPAEGSDTLCLRLENIQGKQVLLHVRDTPGAPQASGERRISLYGVDGLLFVADSTAGREEENVTSLQELQENLRAMQKSSRSIPFIFLYNKRDLPEAIEVTLCNDQLNPNGFLPFYETVATEGVELVPALQQATDLILDQVLRRQES